jgi:hypothetical protein
MCMHARQAGWALLVAWARSTLLAQLSAAEAQLAWTRQRAKRNVCFGVKCLVHKFWDQSCCCQCPGLQASLAAPLPAAGGSTLLLLAAAAAAVPGPRAM